MDGAPGERRIFTIGHGNRTMDELLRLLATQGIGLLVDVRRHPGSRRHPHFSAESLAPALGRHGIAYSWRGEELGGRRTSSTPSRHPAWKNSSFRAYADYMDGHPFRSALETLASEAHRPEPACIMCAETLWWRCHRRLIADALAGHSVDVVHIVDERKTQRHQRHPAARYDLAGYPVYDLATDRELPL